MVIRGEYKSEGGRESLGKQTNFHPVHKGFLMGAFKLYRFAFQFNFRFQIVA